VQAANFTAAAGWGSSTALFKPQTSNRIAWQPCKPSGGRTGQEPTRAFGWWIALRGCDRPFSPMPRPYRRRVLNASAAGGMWACAPQTTKRQYAPSDCLQLAASHTPTCSCAEAMVRPGGGAWRRTDPKPQPGRQRNCGGRESTGARAGNFFWQRLMPRRLVDPHHRTPRWQRSVASSRMSAGPPAKWQVREGPLPKRCMALGSATVALKTAPPPGGTRRSVGLGFSSKKAKPSDPTTLDPSR